MVESFPNEEKTLEEKEKLLVTSNFSFFHRIFERSLLETLKNKGLFGKGLTITVDDTGSFCGQCRSEIRLQGMCSLLSDLHCPLQCSRSFITELFSYFVARLYLWPLKKDSLFM